MKATLISTTNDSFKFMEGIEGNIAINLVVNFDFEPFEGIPFEMRHGRFQSSTIKQYTTEEISRACYELTFITNNSVYVFRTGVYNKDTPPLTEEEKTLMAMAMMF